MKKEEIDWKTGTVECWNMDRIDLSLPLPPQAFDLIEDLIQVHYGDTLVDVGWGPSMSPDGAFFVTVVKNQAWADPLLREQCTTGAAMINCLERAVQLASQK